MNRAFAFAGLALVTLALTGCETASYEPAPMQPRAMPTGVEGNWIDQNGIMSTFRGGTFETRTTDTNSVLATGTYAQPSPNVVQISMHSVLRNTDSSVNCAMVGPARLNCTSSSGAHFSLNRAAG